MSAPAVRQREVSCLALTFFYDYLESHGHPRIRVQEGLAYSPAWLDDRLNWIDYLTFLEIERRVADCFPGVPDLFYDIGRTFASTRGLGFTRVIVRNLVSPYVAYSRVPTIVNRFLFPFVTIVFTRTGPSAMRGHYVFHAGFPPSDAYLGTVRGILTGIPESMGAPPARVVMVRNGTHEVTFDVTITEWTGAGERLSAWFSRWVATWRRRRLALGDAATELEDANRLLQEKVIALTEAKQALDGRVRDLTLLNALARAATGELDARQLLRRAAATISSGLHDAPVALLLVDGDGTALVLAASAGVSPEDQRALRAINANDPAATARVARGPGKVRAGGRAWAASPLSTQDKLVGALFVGLPEAENVDPALFESMAGQLAVSVQNALSYRLVAELRDNLEIRVKERTAELEEARTSLEDTVGRLEQADRAKAEFFTHVNHELLTPVALVLGPLDDLHATLASGRTDDLAVNVQKARRNARVLKQLVKELLDVARLDASALPVERDDLDLVGLAADVVETLRPLADRRTITLVMEPPASGVGVVGDEKLLRRVAVNLVGNAIKYVRPRDVGDAVGLDEDVPLRLPIEPRLPADATASRARVLLVEDDPKVRAFLAKILRRTHVVTDVADAVAAKIVAERDLPDVIVSDVMMQPVDGIQLCRELKANVATRGIPMLLVSARRGSESVLEAFAAGADDYITKPFSPPELLARVNAQIRIRSLALAVLRMEKQHSLGVLSAGIAHELLNPVNAVVNAVPPMRRIVDRLAPDPAAREVTQAYALLEAMEVSGRRMHGVVKGILAYTRQDSAPRPKSTKLSEDVAAILTILRYRLQNVTVHQDYTWDEPLLHYPEWMGQVLMNLVSNALDAMPLGGELWIGLTRFEDTAQLRVRDSGTGVNAELRERIFDPFFTTKEPGQGTGLGLAMAREIVAMHRGTLELDSTEGPGATFVVSLPVLQAPAAAVAEA